MSSSPPNDDHHHHHHHHDKKKAVIVKKESPMSPSKSKATSSSHQQQQPSSTTLFPIGPAAKRELKRALKSATNPVSTITKFQQTHSLHTMMSKALNTIPRHTATTNVVTRRSMTNHDSPDANNAADGTNGTTTATNNQIESLDSDSVLKFLHYINVRQYEVHKRIADAISKHLEMEIRKTTAVQPLLELLQLCWMYATQLAELRPIVWAVLKQLGPETPVPVLIALAERSDTTTASNNYSLRMKHADVFRPLPSSLKRLVWEADWDNITSGIVTGAFTTTEQPPPSEASSSNHAEYKEKVQSTLLFHTVAPYIHQYRNTKSLSQNANKVYVSTIGERRVFTSQRRALMKVTNISTTAAMVTDGEASVLPATTTTTNTSTLLKQASGSAAAASAVSTTGTLASATTQSTTTMTNMNESSHAISHLRSLLCDTVGTASSYRPKLLFALLSMLIAHHGGANLNFNIATNEKTMTRPDHRKKRASYDGSITAGADDTVENDGKENDDTSNEVKMESTTTTTTTTTDPENKNNDDSEDDTTNALLMSGAKNLHCTLVADILLSAGGPLPKAYTHVLALAQVLDECVQEGNVTDPNLRKLQTSLQHIFQPTSSTTKGTAAGGDEDGPKGERPDGSSSNKSTTPTAGMKGTSGGSTKTTGFITKEQQRLLNKHIRNGLEEMKQADTQSLFLNPVTDDIAPGYSKIIHQPMCISQMESKVVHNHYAHMNEWDDDVKLMYKNCINYNQGPAGQWFRGEATRQNKIFKERILPKLRRLHQQQQQKQQQQEQKQQRPSDPKENASTLLNENGKRDATADKMITPLQPSSKRRKKEKEEYIPSMPALASMLLCDPFVVRIFLGRILRDTRVHVIQGNGLPYSHTVIPSLLQILHLTQYSPQVCSIWGRKFIVPPSGLENTSVVEGSDPTERIPSIALRRCMPILVRCMVEAEFDKRFAIPSGDLYSASQASTPVLPVTNYDVWIHPTTNTTVHPLQVVIALVKGTLIHLCQPGNRNEASLHITYPKFALILSQASSSSLILLNDRVFFQCLIAALLRHKSKLPKEAREAVIESWLQWLNPTDASEKGYGSMTSAAHECFLYLLNEWHLLSNAILSRDKLLSYSIRAVQATNASECSNQRRQFPIVWNESKAFTPVKIQYERMLKNVPESNLQQWNETVGLVEKEVTTSTIKMETEET